MTQQGRDFVHQLALHRARLSGAHLQMVVDSMMVGNTAGELWTVAQNRAPPLVVLWDKGN